MKADGRKLNEIIKKSKTSFTNGSQPQFKGGFIALHCRTLVLHQSQHIAKL